MRRYDSYKESSIHWVGKIPQEWGESRVKQYFFERNEKVSDIDYPPLSVTKSGILPQLDNVAKSDNHNDRKRVCHNDFVINSRSDRKGSSGLSELEGSVSLINIVLKPKNIFPKFSEYLFKSKDFVEEFFRNGKGIHWDLWSTRYSELQNIKIPIPPLSEQQQIVSFLDTKTSLIDSFIEKTQRKIELLKEKRTSLINEVVTKGLNPNVEIKDSGVEWIGEIPSHWNLSLVGRHFEIGRGRVISKVEIGDNKGDYPVYSSQTSNNGELGRINTYDFDGEYVTWTTDGANTGTCFFRSGKFNTTNVCGMLSLRNTPYSLPFLSYYLNQVTKPYVRIDINPKLMNNMMSEIPLVIPPLPEQQQIVEYLDKQTQLIDKTISIEEKRIELLKEFRQSLISEVVTGKRKVVD